MSKEDFEKACVWNRLAYKVTDPEPQGSDSLRSYKVAAQRQSWHPLIIIKIAQPFDTPSLTRKQVEGLSAAM